MPVGRTGNTPHGLPFAYDRWENWWTLNRDRYLDVSRTFAARAQSAEMSGDTFLGGAIEDQLASPIFLRRATVGRMLLPVLRASLEDPSAVVRGEAALALGKVGGSDDVSRLARMTKDGNGYVRQLALLGLGLTRDRTALPVLHAYVSSNRKQDTDRAVAALALAIQRDPESLAPLASVLYRQGANRNLVASALYALGFIPHPDATVTLMQFVRQRGNAGDLRAAAALALGKQADRTLVPDLLRLLQDPEVHVRRSAALALGQVPYVSPLWSRRDGLVKKLSTWEADRTLSSEARRCFVDHLAHVERRAATESSHLDRLSRKVVEKLATSLDRDRDQMVRHFSAIALGRIGTSEARTQLSKHYRRKSGMVAARGFIALALGIADAKEAVELLRRGIGKKGLNPSTKSALALGLGLLDDVGYGPQLVDIALSRSDVELRASAAIAAGLMNFRDARVPFRRELERIRHPALRPNIGLALGLLGDRDSLDTLEALVLEGGSTITRVQAVQSLASVRDLASIDILVSLMKGPRITDCTRAAALHAAGQIAEKGVLPGMEPLARDWNYLLPFHVINDAVLR
jgi:HEAT repeat protein